MSRVVLHRKLLVACCVVAALATAGTVSAQRKIDVERIVAVTPAPEQRAAAKVETNKKFQKREPEAAKAQELDGAERRAYEALSAFFANDRASLQQLYQLSANQEYQAGDARPLKVSDAILYLFNNTLTNRDDFLLRQEIAAKQTQSDELRTRIVLSMLEDEYYEINQLKGQNRFNRFTKVFNRASSSLSKLAMLQPQDAAQLLLDSVYSVRKGREASDRERKMVYLGRNFLKKYPNAPERADVEELLVQLRAKLDADWARREKATGQMHLERGNFVGAEFHLETAAVLNAADEESTQLLAQSRAQRNRAEELAAVARMAGAGEAHLSEAEARALEDAARAMFKDDLAALDKAARTSGRIAASIEYAKSACYEKNGRHDAALQQLNFVMRTFTGTPVAAAAAGMLTNRNYNLDQEFDRAVADLEKKRKDYVLMGKRTKEESAYAFGSAAVQSTGGSALGLPFLFVTDMLVRGVAEHFKTQLETDDVVDAGARYMRRYPNSGRTKQIALQLAVLTDKAGKDARATEYYKMADAVTPERQEKLRNDEARSLFDRATKADDLVQRKRLLEQIVQRYGDLKIASKAREQLNKIQPTIAEGSIVLPRKMLERDRTLAEALRLPAAWLDGSKSNGELDNTGIAIDEKAENYSYRLKDNPQAYVAAIDSKQRDDVRIRAKALYGSFEYESTGEELLFRQRLPLEISGGAGEGGVEAAPKFIPYKDNPDLKNFR